MSDRSVKLPDMRQAAIRWLTRHESVATSEIILHRRRIYILPTIFGYYYAITLMVMLLAAMNYNNNMAFVVSFLLTGVGGIAMWSTHRNLLNLSISKPAALPVFAGQTAEFHIEITNPTRHARHALELVWQRITTDCISIAEHGSNQATLRVSTDRRGYLKPGRFVLSTRFPLGLFRAWSWLEFDAHIIVYPTPEVSASPPIFATSANYQGETHDPAEGCDDYAGLREYRPGDPPRHIAWKTLARTQLMSTKLFTGESADQVWLDFDAINVNDTEIRLSILCHWILEFQAADKYFGLRLPNQHIPPANGGDHTQRCLRALALFGRQTLEN